MKSSHHQALDFIKQSEWNYENLSKNRCIARLKHSGHDKIKYMGSLKYLTLNFYYFLSFSKIHMAQKINKLDI